MTWAGGGSPRKQTSVASADERTWTWRPAQAPHCCEPYQCPKGLGSMGLALWAVSAHPWPLRIASRRAAPLAPRSIPQTASSSLPVDTKSGQRVVRITPCDRAIIVKAHRDNNKGPGGGVSHARLKLNRYLIAQKKWLRAEERRKASNVLVAMKPQQKCEGLSFLRAFPQSF